MPIEAAWSYRFPARISREQLLRQERLAKPIRDIAWKGSGAALPTVSHARPSGKAVGDHGGDRARVGGLHLGDRQTGAARDVLKG